MRNVHLAIDGMTPPDARTTPSGRPETATEQDIADNAKLLWMAVRQQLAHTDTKCREQERDGIPGLTWYGSPAKIAATLWDGMDGSPLDDEVLAELYAWLHRTGHMGRLDTGNNSRQWWVAAKWSPAGDYGPMRQAVLPVSPVAVPQEPAYASNGAFTGMRPVSPEPEVTETDYVAVLTGLLADYQHQKRENRRLAAAAATAGDMDELTAENFRLREENEDLRAKNAALRQRAAADDLLLGRR